MVIGSTRLIMSVLTVTSRRRLDGKKEIKAKHRIKGTQV
jgi:hypothetical protein